MKNLQQSLKIAERNLGKSVVEVNNNILDNNLNSNTLFYGVKDTHIPKDFLNKFLNNKNFLQITTDKMSHIGRSIDIDLINPITYRCMTGSSSGSAVNILLGINDFAIATDGGGSVLAPAISTNLVSVLLKGIGFVVDKESVSTDNISFKAGLGILSKDFETLKSVLEYIAPEILTFVEGKVNIVIPDSNNIMLPDGHDMNFIIINKLKKVLNKFDIITYRFTDFYNREAMNKDIANIFDNNLGDIVLTYEGPIDVFGYDETIPKSFNCKTSKVITENGGKGIVKSANMCNLTSFTIPSDNLASGFVISAKEGLEFAQKAFFVSDLIRKFVSVPNIFKKYFIEQVVK